MIWDLPAGITENINNVRHELQCHLFGGKQSFLRGGCDCRFDKGDSDFIFHVSSHCISSNDRVYASCVIDGIDQNHHFMANIHMQYPLLVVLKWSHHDS